LRSHRPFRHCSGLRIPSADLRRDRARCTRRGRRPGTCTVPEGLSEPTYWMEVPGAGTSERRCVEVPTPGPVRSGEFRLTYMPVRPQAGRPHKIAWSPTDGSPSMSLQVRGRLVSDSESTLALRTSRIARTTGADDDTWYFFPSMIEFPASGEWVVVATSGANWGCFIFDVTAPGAPVP